MKLLRKSQPFLTAWVLALPICNFCPPPKEDVDGGNVDMNSDDSNLAADSITTADQVWSLTALTSDSVMLNMAGLNSNTAAFFAQNGTAANLENQGCLTSMFSGNVVTFTAAQCQGSKYGVKGLNGTLRATYTVTGTGAPYTLKVDLSGTGIQVNGATIDIGSSAIITVAGTGRTAMVTPTPNTKASGRYGNMITFAGSYTAGWDGMCTTLEGNFSTKVGSLSWMTVIDSYKRCINSCPAAGGSITVDSDRHATTLSFTNNAMPNKTIDGKQAGTFLLFCP